MSLGITFVESIASAVIDAMGLVIDIPYAQGTRHLDEEGQQQKVQELHDFLVNGNHQWMKCGVYTIIMIRCKLITITNCKENNSEFFLVTFIQNY